MSVDPATTREKVEYAGETYYFCSAGCRESFDSDPARYVAHSGSTSKEQT
jgi:Cu+-exporting ATPase